MNFSQQLEMEKKRASEQVEQLRNENETDLKLLDKLKGEYTEAIFSSDESVIDQVNAQIKEVNGRIKRRSDKLSVFDDKNNPNIQKIFQAGIADFLSEKENLEKEAAAISKKLKATHKELLTGVEKLVEMKKRTDNLNEYIRMSHREMNELTRVQSGLNPENWVHLENGVMPLIGPLLVEGSQVWKR